MGEVEDAGLVRKGGGGGGPIDIVGKVKRRGSRLRMLLLRWVLLLGWVLLLRWILLLSWVLLSRRILRI